ncbi:ABC transporter ATP-binding protein [Dermacoccus nishinomiyaensis]|uniref:ABC transporter ATP-binding protein n=1 Tax=Dermacoccus nishinomiyaensis TaxID=1274 RepID=UPI000DFA25E0|nr:ABC transporter ATP-binding protein [Dermacoccus nishinomiyaensis]QQY23744.1 ABC transporter ATP-binding protein [Dermacoccus nishinomiyaensis]STD13639.1 Glutathione import ATP-binding protein GsiA [Dermacoccus nishinomiyaensis]
MFDKLKKKVDDSVVGEKAEALVDKAGDAVAAASAKIPGHGAGHGVGRETFTDSDAKPGKKQIDKSGTPLLSVRDLKVHWPTDDGIVKSVDGVSFDLYEGQTLGIVGESGSGKSVTSTTIMGLNRDTNAQISGAIDFDGDDLLTIKEDRMRELRGRKMAMIFQDPLSALHPYYTVGAQIIEAYKVHHPKASKKEAREHTIDMLARVGIPSPQKRVDQYPHEFSGGMRQRAMTAMALVNDPKLLIADEPTTALDVTVQAQILDLMLDLQQEFKSAIIIITHDLGVVADVADDLLVMYAGRPVEKGDVYDTFATPQHPYTVGLLNSMPRLDEARREQLDPIPGNPPSLINLPKGCSFAPRCAFKHLVPGDRCDTEMPDLRHFGDQEARCFLTAEQKAEHMKPAQTRTIDGADATTTGTAQGVIAGSVDSHGATKVGD